MNSTISEATPLIPEILADQVCAEALALTGSHPPAVYLCKRAEHHYATNAIFAKKMHAPDCRETLTAFMRNWAAGYLVKHGTPRERIPGYWSNGQEPGPRTRPQPLDLRPGLTDR
jgi:hypothetical protein